MQATRQGDPPLLPALFRDNRKVLQVFREREREGESERLELTKLVSWCPFYLQQLCNYLCGSHCMQHTLAAAAAAATFHFSWHFKLAISVCNALVTFIIEWPCRLLDRQSNGGDAPAHAHAQARIRFHPELTEYPFECKASERFWRNSPSRGP